MDNRTERQKFDDRFPLEEGMSISNPEHYKIYQDSRFEVWLAAKHDAKPVVEIVERKHAGYSPYFVVIGGNDPMNFNTTMYGSKEEAEEWIKTSKFRLE